MGVTCEDIVPPFGLTVHEEAQDDLTDEAEHSFEQELTMKLRIVHLEKLQESKAVNVWVKLKDANLFLWLFT